MSRTIKQLFFGSLFLLLLILAGVFIYFSFFSVKPTCFDGIKNQREEEIDCGGPCLSCQAKKLQIISESPRAFFVSRTQASLVVKVNNQSFNYWPYKFDYVFDVYAADDSLLKSFEGSSSLGLGEARYIIEPVVNINFRRISKIYFRTKNIEWREFRLFYPFIIKTESVKVDIDSNNVVVSGFIVNNSATSIDNLAVYALFFNKSGEMINASGTQIRNVNAFSKRRFDIFLPHQAVIVRGQPQDKAMDVNLTRIIWEIKR